MTRRPARPGPDPRPGWLPWLVPLFIGAVLVWSTVFTGRRHGLVQAIMEPLPDPDTVGHLGLYGALSASIVWVLVRGGHGRGPVLAAVGIVLAIGFADELRQLGAADRTFQLSDLASNLVGALGGAVLARAVLTWRAQGPT